MKVEMNNDNETQHDAPCLYQPLTISNHCNQKHQINVKTDCNERITKSDTMAKSKKEGGKKDAVKAKKLMNEAKVIKEEVQDVMDRAKSTIFELVLGDPWSRFRTKEKEAYEKRPVPDLDRTMDDADIQYWFDAIPLKSGKWTKFEKDKSVSGYTVLAKFMESDFSPENMKFYTACRELESIEKGDKYDYLVKFVSIFDKFIPWQSKFCVNIKFSERGPLIQLYRRARIALKKKGMKVTSYVAPPDLCEIMEDAKEEAEETNAANDIEILTVFAQACAELKKCEYQSGLYLIQFSNIYEEFIESELVDLEVTGKITRLHGEYFNESTRR